MTRVNLFWVGLPTIFDLANPSSVGLGSKSSEIEDIVKAELSNLSLRKQKRAKIDDHMEDSTARNHYNSLWRTSNCIGQKGS
uniref:Uncharacterized protein n=1 Tax=Lactuca sativa TaxID=4236 RepID=A0A9R1UQU0_LACSA|nr:hypothetical protein LSAT_V11C800418690 [Lactuca sativa]